MKIEKLQGRFVVGGAKLDEVNRRCGSMLDVELETEEEVKKWVMEYPYKTGKVWRHFEILPFRLAEV